MNITLDSIFDSYKKLNNNEDFFIYIATKPIISKEKKIIEHKAIIFFTDFDLRRLINSEHLLIDGTFYYPINYYQTNNNNVL